ncbi:hypothetical protein J2S40_002553 [Nocardioides luteus]|nr:hypothetical protein [Nocardioides luteus]MDR7311495.1 hypothetical protein [Nocardioides luteus]
MSSDLDPRLRPVLALAEVAAARPGVEADAVAYRMAAHALRL